MPELVVVVALVGVAGALGIAIGMLVAPRISRWSDRQDEEAGERTDEGGDDGRS